MKREGDDILDTLGRNLQIGTGGRASVREIWVAIWGKERGKAEPNQSRVAVVAVAVVVVVLSR